MPPKCAAYVITFCTFSKQVGGRTGQLTILNTLTIAEVCSATKLFVLFASKWGEGQAN